MTIYFRINLKIYCLGNRNIRRRPAVQRGASPIVSKKELAGGPAAMNGRMKDDLDKGNSF